MSEIEEICLEKAKEVEEQSGWDCDKHDDKTLQEHTDECLDQLLSLYLGEENNYVVDGATIECTQMSSAPVIIKYMNNGTTKMYNNKDCVVRNSTDFKRAVEQPYIMGLNLQDEKIRKLYSLHATESSITGIRVATVSDTTCLRDYKEGKIKKTSLSEKKSTSCEASIVSCGNCKILKASDIDEIEKRWDESKKYGTCYSLIKTAAEWRNPICAESVTGNCIRENVVSDPSVSGIVKIAASGMCIAAHQSNMRFDTEDGQKEGITMLSTLLCTRGGIITVKVSGQIVVGIDYECNLVYTTVTGATLITDTLLNPQGIPLYSGKTMNGKYTYFSLTGYDQAQYSRIAITTDKTRLEGSLYNYVHPIGKLDDLPTSFNLNYHGNFTSNGNTFSLADNRIEIACRWGISTCDGESFDVSLAGKYIDIQLSDGTVLACIIGGSKADESGSDATGVVHHDGSIIEFLETGSLGVNADKADILHGCDIVGAYVYSEKRLYNSTTGEYTYYFSDHIDN